jgi:hypothetical protein
MKSLFVLLFALLPSPCLLAQQFADTTYNPEIALPAYDPGKGSVVFIDEGHFNFHTGDGRYRAFANLLERDGYRVNGYAGEFEKKRLSEGKILVISNALNKMNVEDWYLPNPSAFTEDEINIVKRWVSRGGSLFLIADHMPMAGAAQELAAEFGFEFTNGFVFDTVSPGPAFFTRAESTLGDNIITRGRDTTECVTRIASFTGQAFRAPRKADPILIFNENCMNFLPDTAWVFTAETSRYNVEGWSQGAYKKHRKGKVVMFGEAAMFTAQLAGPDKLKMGMNNEMAPQNYQLLLNIIHWLDGKLD